MEIVKVAAGMIEYPLQTEDHRFKGKIQSDGTTHSFCESNDTGCSWSIPDEMFNMIVALNYRDKEGSKAIVLNGKQVTTIKELKIERDRFEELHKNAKHNLLAFEKQIGELEKQIADKKPLDVNDMLKLKKDFTFTEIRQMRDEGLI